MEKIMFKFLELCVELRMGKRSKDGIIQYRMICQQTNVGSLETVIKHFLRLAEERAKEAQEAADKITLDIDDLEAEESPESIMLSSVSGEDSKERSDREHVTPWLKFLWETYRSVLEILRNNAKLEQVYQETAQQAFSFCLRYKRHTEFRRLCEILRTHLNNISKYQSQPQNISLNSPESLQLHLQTRFSQLNAATELDLWQESYKTIEDIHGLMLMAKKPPKSAMMATYFGKLAEIFWKSDNFLFHAVALYKLWTLHKNSSKISPEELTHLATSLMLASLVSALSQRPCEHALRVCCPCQSCHEAVVRLCMPILLPTCSDAYSALICSRSRCSASVATRRRCSTSTRATASAACAWQGCSASRRIPSGNGCSPKWSRRTSAPRHVFRIQNAV